MLEVAFVLGDTRDSLAWRRDLKLIVTSIDFERLGPAHLCSVLPSL